MLTRTGTPEPLTAWATSASPEASAGWPVIGPETQRASGIEEKTTERATSGEGSRRKWGGELGVDVEEETASLGADLAPVTKRVASRADPESKIAGEGAGEDLAGEGGSGRGGDGEGRPGIPEDIDPERHGELAAQGGDDVGHGRDRGDVGVEPVGTVILVAEHHRVDAAALERLQVTRDPVAHVSHAAGTVVERRAGQGGEVRHTDDRLPCPG